ncbi:Fatty acyl-CoA reductase wat [Araneus ventricosus]|uniref:Fatty acyl-CoA reductase wat n=1 Tax=Araneus ventricosus TaxID=182803 RepID=A0A4Y2HCP5_ARAVE|nr:Fatty acyl-CoA reductase wat [Araneus ventricosus]
MGCDSSILPRDRVRDAATFEIVGVVGDLAGPLHLRNGPKAYIGLYTCAVYRSIHLEIGKGIIKVVKGNPNCKLNLVPADIVANAHVLAAWSVGTKRCASPLVINCTATENLHVNFCECTRNIVQMANEFPLPRSFDQHTNLITVPYKYLYCIIAAYYHYLPAIVLDGMLRILGKKPRIYSLYRFLDSVMKSLNYFSFYTFEFERNNLEYLDKVIHPEDRKDLTLDFRDATFLGMALSFPEGSPFYDWKVDKKSEWERQRIKHKRHMLISCIQGMFLVICFSVAFRKSVELRSCFAVNDDQKEYTTRLKVARGRVKASLTRLENTADLKLKNEILIRLQSLEDLSKEIEKLDAELSVEDSEIVEFDDRYFSLKLKLQNKIDALNVSHSTTVENQNSSVVVQSNSNFRLPKLNIPVFSGKFENWMNFQDLFVSTVHSQISLSNSQKIQYLKGLLSDKPASLIKYIPLSNDSYEEAWEKLIDRYDKKKQIVHSLIKTFLKPI